MERYEHMKSKKIIILGAGIYQVPLIMQAKKMGLYVIVISVKGNYPGFALADKCYYIDTKDYKEILKIAMCENIDGICTTGTDVAVKTIGYVCDKMQLCGIGTDSANKSTDKFLMKQAFQEANVRTANFIKATCANDAIDFLNKTGKPIVLKPVDSSGSRGVTVAKTSEDIINRFDEILKYSQKDYIVVEEFIKGEEIGVDLFVYRREIVVNAIHGKITFDNGYSSVPLGHYFPFETHSALLEDINTQSKRVVKALGFNNCAVNMDVLINNEGAFIIEASGRAGATCIPELISKYYGFNYYEKIILTALGEDVSFEINSLCPCAAKLLISNKTGFIKKQEYVKKNDSSAEIVFDYKVGDFVNEFKVGPDRVGHIIVDGNNFEEEQNIIFEVEQ